MTPTLNQQDIKMLKVVFATKEDFEKLKTALLQTVVSKKDLEQLEEILANQFAKIEKNDSDQNQRIRKLEDSISLGI